MKATGIVRKIDELGRVVLPKEIRRTFDIKEKDPIEIYVEGNNIFLKKYIPGCMFCGSLDDYIYYQDNYICRPCIEDISENLKEQELRRQAGRRESREGRMTTAELKAKEEQILLLEKEKEEMRKEIEKLKGSGK